MKTDAFAKLLFLLAFTLSCGDDGDGTVGAFEPIANPESRCENLGNIDVETVLSSKCYYVAAEIVVSADLEIRPGVELYFAKDAGIKVIKDIELRALGTSQKNIVFTGAKTEPGFWKGIYFLESIRLSSTFEHVLIQSAGSAPWHPEHESGGAVIFEDSWVNVFDSTIRGNRGVGVLSLGTSLTSVRRTRMESNELPLVVRPVELFFLEDLKFGENEKNYIFVRADSAVTAETEWSDFGIPYRIDGRLVFHDVVRINPGVVFEFTQNSSFEINQGTLLADATGGAQIVFRGTEDVPGFWKGVGLYDSVKFENILGNAAIINGGSSSSWSISYEHRAGLYVHGGTSSTNNFAILRIKDLTVTGSPNCGVSVTTSGEIYGCTNSNFHGNGMNACTEGIYCLR